MRRSQACRSRPRGRRRSIPYYASGLSILVSAQNTTIKGAADLAGKTIGALTGSTAIDYIHNNLKDSKVLSFSAIGNAFLALQAGRVDAVLYDTPVVSYYAATAGQGQVRLLHPPMTSGEYYGIAFPKGSKLVGPVNDELRKLVASGAYTALYQKWFATAPDFLPK